MSNMHIAANRTVTEALNELIKGLVGTASATQVVIIGEHNAFGPFSEQGVPLSFVREVDDIESLQGIEGANTLIVWLHRSNETRSGFTPNQIWRLYRSGATIVRISVQDSYIGNTFLRQAAYNDFNKNISLPPVLSGQFCLPWAHPYTIFAALYNRTIEDTRADAASETEVERPVAIITAFNECDVIGEAIEDLIEQDCDVVVLDNWSDDGGYEVVQRLKELYPDRVLIHERFPEAPTEKVAWVDILQKKEELATAFPGRWIIHTDADEFRRSPFPKMTLAQGLHSARKFGANRVSFTVLNFRPVQDTAAVEGRYREDYRYFELPDHPSYFLQSKAWIQPVERVNLSASGGHIAEFTGAVDFPLRFSLHHLPIRSQIHASRKISLERASRWSEKELKDGWHSHYDRSSSKSYIWIANSLEYYQPSMFAQDYGFILATPLAAFFSPFWRGKKSTMRQWLDVTYLEERLASQGSDARQMIAKVELMERWLASLDPRTFPRKHDPYDGHDHFDSLKADLNAALKAIIGGQLIRKSPLVSKARHVERIMRDLFFSNNWYLNRYPDVAMSGIEPIKHYIKYGASEGRDPTSFFSTLQYLLENPDVAASKINPLVHFITYGAREGRNGVHRIYLG